MVAPERPYPPTWGFAMRVHHLAKELSRSNRVSLLAYGDGPGTPNNDAFVAETLVSRSNAPNRKRRAQLASVVSRGSYHLGGLRSHAMQDRLSDLLRRERFDIVQLESSQMSFLESPPDTCTVLDEHNVEYTLLSRLATLESSPARRAFGQLESAKARREEAAAWRRSTGCVFTSEVDLQEMRRSAAATPACVVPNGVDLAYFRPTRAIPAADTLVYTGTMNYRPNADAVAFFVREVLPRILRLRAAVRLVVVGQGAPPSLLRLASDHVEFTGAVEDVRPYLARAAVVVAPIRIGSGTRLKIMEAMAMARPVVTTTIGCEGLPVLDGEHVLVANDPETFSESTVRLLSERRFATELAQSGLALAEREFGWASCAARLERFYDQITTTKHT